MPAKKPAALIERHETKAEKQARLDVEAAFDTGIDLPKGTPAELKDHRTAAAVWRRLMREFMGIENAYVISLDRELLLNYCILVEQLEQLDLMRQKAFDVWTDLSEKFETLKDELSLTEIAKISDAIARAFDKIVKLDARADRKRTAMFNLQKSLYMTPRSRAGATPPKKPPEQPKDDMEKLLEETPEAAPEDSGEKE